MQSEIYIQGTWLAQLEEDATPDLRVVSLRPTLGVEITKTNLKKNLHIAFDSPKI